MNEWTICIFIQSAHTDTEKYNAQIEKGALQILDFVSKFHFNLKWKIGHSLQRLQAFGPNLHETNIFNVYFRKYAWLCQQP